MELYSLICTHVGAQRSEGCDKSIFCVTSVRLCLSFVRSLLTTNFPGRVGGRVPAGEGASAGAAAAGAARGAAAAVGRGAAGAAGPAGDAAAGPGAAGRAHRADDT